MSRWILALIFTLSTSIALADPIHFDEAVDGDISSAYGDPLLNFGFGANVIDGTAQIAGNLTGSSDGDNFAFVLPTESLLSTFTFEYSGGTTPESDETFARMIFRIVDASGAGTCFLSSSLPNVLAGEGSVTYDTCSSGGLDWSDLGSGTYYVIAGLRSGADGTTGDSWNYSLTFSVTSTASVPEPGTLALLGVGLLAMGATRRRRKT